MGCDRCKSTLGYQSVKNGPQSEHCFAKHKLTRNTIRSKSTIFDNIFQNLRLASQDGIRDFGHSDLTLKLLGLDTFVQYVCTKRGNMCPPMPLCHQICGMELVCTVTGIRNDIIHGIRHGIY